MPLNIFIIVGYFHCFHLSIGHSAIGTKVVHHTMFLITTSSAVMDSPQVFSAHDADLGFLFGRKDGHVSTHVKVSPSPQHLDFSYLTATYNAVVVLIVVGRDKHHSSTQRQGQPRSITPHPRIIV